MRNFLRVVVKGFLWVLVVSGYIRGQFQGKVQFFYGGGYRLLVKGDGFRVKEVDVYFGFDVFFMVDFQEVVKGDVFLYLIRFYLFYLDVGCFYYGFICNEVIGSFVYVGVF